MTRCGDQDGVVVVVIVIVVVRVRVREHDHATAGAIASIAPYASARS